MLWFWLALLSPAIQTLSTFGDKYIIDHKMRHTQALAIYSAIVSTGFATIIWLLSGWSHIAIHDAVLLLLAGIFSIFSYVFYVQALSRSHASYTLAAMQTTPALVLLFSNVFLHEKLSLFQVVGFVLILLSSVKLSLSITNKKFAFNTSFWLILAGNLFVASAAIIIKFTSHQTSFASVLTYEGWGIGLGGLMLLILLSTIRTSFYESVRTATPNLLAIITLNKAVFMLSKATSFYAILLGPVAIVTLLADIQVLYGLLLGILLTYLAPNFFSEDTGLYQLKAKVAPFLGIFIGIYLLTI